MRKYATLIVIAFLIVSAAADEAKDIAITIYNNNLGLVKDVRSLAFTKGINSLDFDDVASQIDATSVSFRCLDDKNIQMLEQNFLYDLVSTDALLKRYLGLNIEVISEDEGRYKGKLLSYDGRNIILQGDDGQVMMVSLDKVIDYKFPSLPEGLILKPTLHWMIDSPSSGNKRCEVSYLTNGINWQADYVAVVNDSDTRIDLSGWVTINNNTGATYEDARLKLVAGNIHRVEQRPQQPLARYEALSAKGAPAPQFEEESFFEYHLYTLNRPATLHDKEIKQLSLFPTTEAKVKKVYIFDSQSNYYWYGGNNSEPKVNVNLEFKNTKESGLGMPLPKGKIRVYKEDSQKALQFIGEDMIDHTPKDEEVRIYLGDAFDITGERKQVNVEDLGKGRRRETYEITLKNHKDSDIVVTVIEHPQGWREWEIRSSSLEYKKIDNYKIEFDVPVKSNGEETLTYVIQYN
jgi:hypothetical protein